MEIKLSMPTIADKSGDEEGKKGARSILHLCLGLGGENLKLSWVVRTRLCRRWARREIRMCLDVGDWRRESFFSSSMLREWRCDVDVTVAI